MPADPPPPLRVRLRLRGAVQGVGFRPFVHRLATELGLAGHVLNDPAGVVVELEGGAHALAEFERRLFTEKPPASTPEVVERTPLACLGDARFEIRASAQGGAPTAVLLPDLATCAECAREVNDAGNRRHRYPFTNCTHCGPRFSIILGVPYDRPRTTMGGFTQCPRCAAEYADPGDRRFHAQPNACPACGPHLSLTDATGTVLAERDGALAAAVALVRGGGVLALHGLGGFHLIVDARSEAAVTTLRERKARWEKPFALMVPDLAAADSLCELEPATRELLASPMAPIVLAPRRADGARAARIADAVAPNSPLLGVMLPYTPLHHLLLGALGHAVVATSGNVTDEPLCTSPEEARTRLGHLADRFLVHDRPIARQVDDSVVTMVAGAPQPLRRSRGYAPRPLRLARPGPTVLAVGPHQKNTITLTVGDEAFVSQHVGDLKNPIAAAAHARVVRDFLELYAASPVAVAHDLHPDYASTTLLHEARALGAQPGAPAWQRQLASARTIAVQHHHAHLVSCLAEHRREGPALGVTWDGTGLGPDGTLWGGEFLLGDARGYRRAAHLRPFRLPGGDAAVKEPRRIALSLLHAADLLEAASRAGASPLGAFTATERGVLDAMLDRELNTPVTTSAGRLFDGLAALAGVRQRCCYEAQAAIEFEVAAWGAPATSGAYPCPVVAPNQEGLPGVVNGAIINGALLDWAPLVASLLEDVAGGTDPAVIAARCHAGLAEAICATAVTVGQGTVVLTGGCFQNRWLTERAAGLLGAAGFEVLLHREVPPNDGGVSLGQAVIAAATIDGGPGPGTW